MILLVSGLTGAWYEEYRHLAGNVGFLVTPSGNHKPETVLAHTRTWAADNDCFQGLDKPAFERMLAKWHGQPGGLWVNAPDVVGDARATLERFAEWEPKIHGMGFRVTLTLQDGQEGLPVPWESLEAVFLGGSTRWKLSAPAVALCKEAKERGKWVHVGRVNSLNRMRWAAQIGADSIDGSGFSRWRKRIARGVRWLRQSVAQARSQQELFPLESL